MWWLEVSYFFLLVSCLFFGGFDYVVVVSNLSMADS